MHGVVYCTSADGTKIHPGPEFSYHSASYTYPRLTKWDRIAHSHFRRAMSHNGDVVLLFTFTSNPTSMAKIKSFVLSWSQANRKAAAFLGQEKGIYGKRFRTMHGRLACVGADILHPQRRA